MGTLLKLALDNGVSSKSTLSLVQPSWPDASITTATGGHRSSRVTGNKGQNGVEEAGKRTRTTDTITSHWVFIRNKLLEKGRPRGEHISGYGICFPKWQLCVLRPSFPGQLLADRKQWPKCSFCWAWLHIRWDTILVTSGQLSQLYLLTAFYLPSAYCQIVWKNEK